MIDTDQGRIIFYVDYIRLCTAY